MFERWKVFRVDLKIHEKTVFFLCFSRVFKVISTGVFKSGLLVVWELSGAVWFSKFLCVLHGFRGFVVSLCVSQWGSFVVGTIGSVCLLDL